jgi:hypothetical protein
MARGVDAAAAPSDRHRIATATQRGPRHASRLRFRKRSARIAG